MKFYNWINSQKSSLSSLRRCIRAPSNCLLSNLIRMKQRVLAKSSTASLGTPLKCCVAVELFVRTTTDANKLSFPFICRSEAVKENFLHLISAVAAIVAGRR